MRTRLSAAVVVSLALCLSSVLAAGPDEKAPPNPPGRIELPKDQGTWTGEIPAGKTIEVKSLVGPIRVEPATGSATTVEIRRIVPPGVADYPVVHVVSHEKGVTICPVYSPSDPEKPNECVPGRGKGRMKSPLWEKGVTFEYVVHVPAGVNFAGETATGAITGKLLESDVDVKTFKSEIRLLTGRSTKAEGMRGVTVELAPTTVERRVELKVYNSTGTVLIPRRTKYWYGVDVLNGQIRAADGPKIEVAGQSRKASKSGGPSTMPSTTITIDTINGDAVLDAAPD